MRDKNAVLASLLESGASSLGIDLPSDAIAAFESYFMLLEDRGRSVNLTAIKGEEDVARLHFLDSIALLRAIQFKDASIIDIGSGAGFPGIPLKIAEPSVSLTLLDSSRKRISFVSELCAALGIKADFILSRAEDSARTASLRENFDIVVSRSVARLNILCELCLPFVRLDGAFIAMKGVDSAGELSEALAAIKTLGAEFLDHFDYTLPGTDITHRAIIIRKSAETPSKYPRRFPRIEKTPL